MAESVQVQVEFVYPDLSSDVISISSKLTVSGVKRILTQRPSYPSSPFKYLSPNDFDICLSSTEIINCEFAKFGQCHPKVQSIFETLPSSSSTPSLSSIKIFLIPKESAKNRVSKVSQTKPENNTPANGTGGGGGGGSSSPGVMIGNRTRSQTQPRIIPAIFPSSPPSSSVLSNVMAIGGNSATNLNQLLPTVPSAPPVIPLLPLRTTTEPLNRLIPSANPGTRPPARPQPPLPHSSPAHNRRRSRSVGDLASIVPKMGPNGSFVERTSPRPPIPPRAKSPVLPSEVHRPSLPVEEEKKHTTQTATPPQSHPRSPRQLPNPLSSLPHNTNASHSSTPQSPAHQSPIILRPHLNATSNPAPTPSPSSTILTPTSPPSLPTQLVSSVITPNSLATVSPTYISTSSTATPTTTEVTVIANGPFTPPALPPPLPPPLSPRTQNLSSTSPSPPAPTTAPPPTPSSSTTPTPTPSSPTFISTSSTSDILKLDTQALNIKLSWGQKTSRSHRETTTEDDILISCNLTTASTSAHLKLDLIEKLKRLLMLLSSGELSVYESEKLSSIEPLLQSSYFTNCREKGITPHLVLTPVKEKGGSQIISSPTPTPSTPLPVSPLAWSSRSPSSTASPAQRLNREESFSAPSPPAHLSPITSRLPFTLVRSASVSEEVSIPHNTNSVKMVLRQQAVKPNPQNPPSPTTSSSNIGSHIAAPSKKNAFSTVKITEKHRTHLQNIFSRPLAPKVADKEEVADFRNSLKDCVRIWQGKKAGLNVTNTRVTENPFPSFLPSSFLIVVQLPRGNLYKSVTCRADQSVQDMFREVAIQSNQILEKTDYVIRICGVREYLHQNQTLGNIIYVRDALRTKKPIIFTIVEKQTVGEEYDALVVPNDLSVPQELSRGQIDKTLVVFDRPSAHRENSPATTEYTDASQLDKPLRFNVVSLSNLYIHYPYLEDMQDALFYVEIGVFHAGQALLPQPMRTVQTSTQLWGFWLECPLRLCDIPPATRLCITLFCRRRSLKEDIPLGWVNHQLFNYKGLLCVGAQNLCLWLGAKANPIGTCSHNQESAMPLLLTLEFPSFDRPVRYTSPPIWTADTDIRSLQFVIPPDSLKATLEAIISKDTLYRLTADEKSLLWNHRNYLSQFPKALPKVLMCVDWTDPQFFAEAIRMLPLWRPPNPVDALELLEWKYAAPEVREYAVMCLSQMSDRELLNYLLQLVQVLKYEHYHDSPLARFLLQRAIKNRAMIGHALFWHLQSEIDVPFISERYSLMLETYLQNCGAQTQDFTLQQEFTAQLCAIAHHVKTVSGKKSRVKTLRERLSLLSIPASGFRLPVNPNILVKSLVVEKAKLLHSATLPLWLEFDNSDSYAEPFRVIFKAGDDLRQDVLVLQMFEIMNRLWQDEGLDIRLTPYRCISTGDGVGMIEVVPDSQTVAKIQKEYSGVAAALMKTPLANWLRVQNPGDANYETAVENFVSSCAGYCVATYVLGIGDRHNDNIMVTKSGLLFHIDFSKFLGNVERWQGIKRERAPFVFTPEFAYVMGGKGSPQFEKFVTLACDAYIVLRKYSHLFINLFSMMLSTGLPELNKDEDINHLRNAFCLDQTEPQARETFLSLIFESLKTKTTQINFLIHNLAHINN